MLNAVLIKTLPYPDADGIVLLCGTTRSGNQFSQVSFTDLQDWKSQSTSFEEMVAFGGYENPVFSGRGEPEHVSEMKVSDGYFALMKTGPMMGRTFQPDEQQEGNERETILSYGFWNRRFGGDPNVIGKSIDLDGLLYTIVGVMPPTFHSLPRGLVRGPIEIYVPLAGRYDNAQRAWTWLRGIARLKPGASLERAQSELNLIAQRQQLQYSDTNAGRGVRIVRLQDHVVGAIRTPLLILQAAVVLLVLIGCLNLANLLLARLTARTTEMALRASLGATRIRLIRQLLIEGMLLSTAGGACGLIVICLGTGLTENIGRKVLPDISVIDVDPRVLCFTLFVSMLCGIIFCLIPALQLPETGLLHSLKAGAHRSTPDRRRLRRPLVVSEIALAFILLVGAGLLVRSFVNLIRVSPGFDPQNVLTMNIALPQSKYPRGEPAQTAFFRDLVERVGRLQGVEQAAVVSVLPESANFDHTQMRVEGREYREGEYLTPDVYRISPGYFAALSIPIIRGRAFSDSDDAAHPPVAIINEMTARALWPGEDPVGKQIWSGAGKVTRTIVGAVGDVYQYGLDSPMTMQLYVPHAENFGGNMTLVARTAGNPASFAAQIRSAVSAIDKDQPVYGVETMDRVLADSWASRRFSTRLLAVFALTALALAAIGVSGVFSYSVTQRMKEFGIRLALGAEGMDLLKDVMKEASGLALWGVAIGLAGAYALTRFLGSLLFGVRPADVLTLCSSILLLSAVALISAYLPARRATKIDPLIALRYE